MTTTAENTSRMASIAACCALLPELAHVALDVLDHDDRIVHDDAGGEHDAEERQRVDGEAEQLDERERADERHRNRDRRNDRAAPVLQEQEHHEDDEADRFGQRLQHFDDRLADDDDVVEGELPLQPGRELIVSRRVHLRASRRRNASSALADGSSWMPTPDASTPREPQPRRVVFGAELHAADVLHAHERAVLAGLDDDVFELRSPRSAGRPRAR